MHDRMASTIRHNRARGSHNIELMSTIVAELVEMGKGDHWICKFKIKHHRIFTAKERTKIDTFKFAQIKSSVYTCVINVFLLFVNSGFSFRTPYQLLNIDDMTDFLF